MDEFLREFYLPSQRTTEGIVCYFNREEGI